MKEEQFWRLDSPARRENPTQLPTGEIAVADRDEILLGGEKHDIMCVGTVKTVDDYTVIPINVFNAKGAFVGGLGIIDKPVSADGERGIMVSVADVEDPELREELEVHTFRRNQPTWNNLAVAAMDFGLLYIQHRDMLDRKPDYGYVFQSDTRHDACAVLQMRMAREIAERGLWL